MDTSGRMANKNRYVSIFTRPAHYISQMVADNNKPQT